MHNNLWLTTVKISSLYNPKKKPQNNRPQSPIHKVIFWLENGCFIWLKQCLIAVTFTFAKWKVKSALLKLACFVYSKIPWNKRYISPKNQVNWNINYLNCCVWKERKIWLGGSRSMILWLRSNSKPTKTRIIKFSFMNISWINGGYCW